MKDKELNELTKLKKTKDSWLLKLEVFLGLLVIILFLACIFLSIFTSMYIKEELKISIILIGVITLIPGVVLCLKIEQIAGYYKCKNCNYKYIPKYRDIFWAMHIGRTRYMKCPTCEKYSWNKKVLTKED